MVVRALKWIGGAVLVLFIAFALFFTFGVDTLRGPITSAVTKATGRELIIAGELKPVWSWLHPRIRAERVTFANAAWGKADYLLDADAIEASISLLPLLAGRVVLPDVHLERAKLSLEQDAKGRKNWIPRQEPKEKQESRFSVKLLTLDDALLHWEDAARKHSLAVDLSTDETGVQFMAVGSYGGKPLKASGHAGHVLSIRDQKTPFPLKGEVSIGGTSARLEGTLTGIVGFKGIDLRFERLAGKSMDELYDIIGLAFPATSPYTVSGRLYRTDGTWLFEDFTGKVGESDLAGWIRVQTGAGKRPFMQGEVTAKLLNFADLGALVGADRPRKKGVLPDMPFSPERWESVDADVKIDAGTIKRPEQLPIERFATRVVMRDRVLTLDPLSFGIADGRLAGTVRLDGNHEPMRGEVKMRVQNLQLAKMFPRIEQTKSSVGDVEGLIELSGSGNSVGKLLASANGKVGAYMDHGKISQLLMELVALDLWDVARIKLRGDKDIDIRCGIADFRVKDGVMQTNALIFDTSVVNVGGSGSIDLKNERMDLTLKPQPKDGSVASLRTPLYIRGTFGQPDVGVNVGRIAARGAGALAMGILNPLLAVLPLLDEGKGKDSNCAAVIRQATSLGQSSASGATTPRPPSPAKH
ncbi:MAG TPA: AsmA family protein [Burkholderiales bacterium]|nr:AsmA family protein [Burkholderiales bacterium]